MRKNIIKFKKGNVYVCRVKTRNILGDEDERGYMVEADSEDDLKTVIENDIIIPTLKVIGVTIEDCFEVFLKSTLTKVKN